GDFVRPLREEGVDLVIGNRFAGEMERGAMPFLNRYIGNPILSGMTRLLFGVPLTDIHCGMRAIRRERVRALNLVMPGMEFATEMIVKALDLGMRVKEVPIPYRPRIGPSKLNPLRDAWRHTEYMLVFSPALLFLVPGVLLLAAGLTVQLLLLSGPKPLFFRTWDVHTNLAGLAMSLCGSTLLALGVVCSTYADSIGMHFRHSAVARVAVRLGDVPLRGVGVVFLLLGAGLWLRIIGIWVLTDFGTLAAVADLSAATSLLAAGLELLVAAFLTRIVRMGRMT
ncbi:glycosyltransferase family 2 protein, partial [Sphaerobacter sp.]|uniref:glycosyltransferase family 2 protein n=1 Tax=Sphaerobacter sp. TaxID=2099654 RepID=UPI00345AB3DF